MPLRRIWPSARPPLCLSPFVFCLFQPRIPVASPHWLLHGSLSSLYDRVESPASMTRAVAHALCCCALGGVFQVFSRNVAACPSPPTMFWALPASLKPADQVTACEQLRLSLARCAQRWPPDALYGVLGAAPRAGSRTLTPNYAILRSTIAGRREICRVTVIANGTDYTDIRQCFKALSQSPRSPTMCRCSCDLFQQTLTAAA